jgi:hypothetical protein
MLINNEKYDVFGVEAMQFRVFEMILRLLKNLMIFCNFII